jgi:sterol desaturase/sphingolipid hydroxylase (fatty acid hydroxylase superfamily)
MEFPGSVRREDEARKARRRLYPVSVLYSAYSLTTLGVALRGPHRWAAVGCFSGGIVVWTAVEYLVHRYVLHGRFPDGPGVVRRFLHRYFDHLHWEHHKRPWDGNHVNGTTRDTLPFVLVLVALSFLAPLHTGPAFVAGVLQAYIVEEWIHHSVHFCTFKGRYFQYIRRHHMYHHSPRGIDVAFGLTSGMWDVVWRTRISKDDRHLLHGRGSSDGSAGTAVRPPTLPQAG